MERDTGRARPRQITGNARSIIRQRYVTPSNHTRQRDDIAPLLYAGKHNGAPHPTKRPCEALGIIEKRGRTALFISLLMEPTCRAIFASVIWKALCADLALCSHLTA